MNGKILFGSVAIGAVTPSGMVMTVGVDAVNEITADAENDRSTE